MSKTVSWAKATLYAAPNLIAFVFYGLLFFRAITTVDTYWDSLAYHLPFAARLVGILDTSEFILPQQIEEYYAGFPKLAELLQGVFWRLTGRIAGTNLVSWLSILAVNIVASVRLRLKFWLVALVLFSIPLVVIQSTTSYIDLIAGSFFSIGLINLLASVHNNKYTPVEFLLIGIPLALSANVKYNLAILAVVVLVCVTLLFLIMQKSTIFTKENRKQLVLYVVFGLIIMGVLSGFMIKNWIQFDNPVYPLNAKLGQIQFSGGEHSPYYYETKSLGRLDKFGSFIVSLSEIPLWIQNPEPLWVIDMSSFVTPEGSSLYRIGGYFGVNIIFWSFIILIAVIILRKNKRVLWYGIGFMTLFVLVGFMPSSMMLRYWLFLPIIMGILSVFLVEHQIIKKKTILALFIGIQLLIFAFVIYKTQDFIIPNSFTIERRVIQAYELTVESDGICLSDNPPIGFLYKMANMDLVVESVGPTDVCDYPLLEVSK